jgi:hypothetical protein
LFFCRKGNLIEFPSIMFYDLVQTDGKVGNEHMGLKLEMAGRRDKDLVNAMLDKEF